MTATPPPPQDPQGQPPRFQAIRDLARQGPAPVKFSAIRDIAKQRASEADGFLENVGLQTLGALKTFGDAAVNVAALAVKAGSGAVSAVSGGSFGQGYDQATQGFQEAYGTGDPGIFELLHVQSAESAMYQAYPMGRTAPQGTVGQQTDAYLRAKLGRSAIIGETIGHLASFVTGPGALAGRAGSAVAKPVIQFAEKSVSRMASLRAGVVKGGLWEQIAAMPKWKQTLARLPGNYMANTLSASANLMAASYATAKDSDRLASAKAVASTAWILAPAAQVGQQIEAAILSRAIGPEGATVARQALARWQAGEMSAQALDATIRGLTSRTARGVATGISSFGESLMFLGADPHIHDLYSQAMKGDPNAIADLTMMFASNWAGLAVAKGIVPHDQAGLLKTLLPDYNKLSSYLEAQAVKEVQEPAGPRSKDEMAKDLEQTLQDSSQEPKPGESRDPWDAWEQARQEWVQKMDVQWAEVPADAAIKSGWEPRATGNGVLELTFSPRFSARMERGEVSRNQPSFLPQDPTGPIRLDLGAAEQKALRDVGVELPEGPLTDQAAQYALESLTMLGMFRKLQADVAFQKMGLREIEPGVYASDYEGKQVRIDLDGKVLERDALGTEPWKVSENQTLDYGLDMSQAQWSNQTEQGLAMMLAQKQAIAPDTLVDGILTYVLAESQAGNSIGAQQIREFLANTPLDQLVASIKPGSDRALAMELGRIAMGHDNAQNAMQQRAQKVAEVQAQQAVEGAGREGAALEGQPNLSSLREGDTFTPDPEKFYRGFQTPEENTGRRHMDKGKMWVDAFVLELDTNATPSGANNTYRGRVDPDSVSKVFVDVNAYTEYPSEYVAELKAQYPKAEFFDAKLDDTESTFIILKRHEMPARAAGREGEQGSLVNVLEPVTDAVVEGAVAAKDVTGAVAGRIKDVVGQPQGEWLSEVLPGAEEPHMLRRADARAAEISSKYNEPLRRAKKESSGARYNEQRDMADIVPEAKGLEMSISRGRALTDKRVKPETDAEKAWVEATQDAVRGVWEDVRQSGGFQVRDGKVEPMRARDRGVISFEQGKDAKDVYQNDTLRKQWFNDLVTVHPDKMVAETKVVKRKDGTEIEVPVYEGKGKDRKVKMRRMTGEDLEKRYQTERKKLIEGKVSVEDADVAVATEFQREFVNTPDMWRGRRMLETNPLRAIDSMVRKQAAAAAVNETIGPDLPSGTDRGAVIADLKARLKETPDDADVQRLLEKLETTSGVEGLVSRVAKAAAERYPNTTRAQEIVQVTRDYAQRIQKSEPVKLGDTRRIARRYQQITSQAKTLASGVYDIGEMFLRPWMLGSYRDVFGATMRLFKGNPLKAIPEAIKWAEDFGMMLRDSGDLNISETDSKLQKGLDVLSFPSMSLEKTKGVTIAHVADSLVGRVQKGKANAADVSWLRDWLRMSPQDVAAIEAGKVPSSDVIAQIRRESMVEMANRTTPSEASRFAANPNTHVYLRFVKWATRRLWSTVKTGSSLVSAGKALREAQRLKDADLISKRTAQMRAAMWRSTKVLLGFTASGVVSQALSAMLYELFRSFSPLEGIKNWWSAFATKPWENTAKAAFLQMLGGPYATMAETILSGGNATASDVLRMAGLPGEAFKLGMDSTKMVEDTIANASYEGWLAAAGRDFPKMAQMIVNLGVVPKQGYHVLAAAMGAMLGDDLSYDRDNSVLTKFRIENNLMGGGGSGDTPPAYSEDLRRLAKVLTEDLTPEEREQKVMGLLRKAMSLKDTDSIAASLDGMAPLSRLTPENLAKFREYADDGVVDRIREREANIKALAKVVRKMEGGAQSDWQEELDTVARNAQAGFGSHWDDLMSRALQETAARRVAGEGEGTQLRELAQTMALFPDQMAQLFKGDSYRPILRASSTSRRANLIYRELRKRMTDRVDDTRREQRRERRGN